MTTTDPVTLARATTAARVAADKHGSDIVVLGVGEIIAIVYCFVLVSASNTRQVRTIVDEVRQALAGEGPPIGVEGLDDATWVLLDFGDVAVHVFLDATRSYYDLDRLWADATRVDWEAEASTVGAERR